jgi:hypothetical protein
LIAASVWMKKLESLTPPAERASAEMMPLVTVWFRPERVADRQHHVADLDRVGVAQLDERELLARVSMRSRARS